jgi:hypothetical protein
MLTAEEKKERAREHRYRELRRLYREVFGACGAISNRDDARYTAGILRALANELDPKGKGDPRAETFFSILKGLMNYNP